MKRSLPKNICHHPDGYLVRVRRGGVIYQAFVAGHSPAALIEAVARRDRFVAIYGTVTEHRQGRVFSNTGICGVSETVSWSRWVSNPCFNVSWRSGGRQHCRRVYYGRHRTREEALRLAVALRQRMIQRQEVACP